MNKDVLKDLEKRGVLVQGFVTVEEQATGGIVSVGKIGRRKNA